MLRETYEVFDTESLPDLGLFVRENGTLLSGLSSGYTFELKVADLSGTAMFTKSSGFTGQAGTGAPPDGTPNLVVQWATSGEIATLSAGSTYKAQLKITRNSDSRVRFYSFLIACREVF